MNWEVFKTTVWNSGYTCLVIDVAKDKLFQFKVNANDIMNNILKIQRFWRQMSVKQNRNQLEKTTKN